MTVGDVISDTVVITASGRLNIRPPVGEEWVIHNINGFTDYTGGNSNADWNITTSITNDASGMCWFNRESINANTGVSFSSFFSKKGLNINVTNLQWIQIFNNSAGGTITISYSGIKIKG